MTDKERPAPQGKPSPLTKAQMELLSETWSELREMFKRIPTYSEVAFVLHKFSDAFALQAKGASSETRSRMLSEEDWRLVSTAEQHLRTWATSKNKEPYANTLDVAKRLDELLIRALKESPERKSE